MIPFSHAQALIQETMNKAFTKNLGTKKGRVAFAQRCCSRVYTGRDVELMVWACDYAAKWGRA